jgi:hypothetical protein
VIPRPGESFEDFEARYWRLVPKWIVKGNFARGDDGKRHFVKVDRTYNGFTNEERWRSIVWLAWADFNGLHSRPKQCVACLSTEGYIIGHWETYAWPFSADYDIPLCRRCHTMVHTRLLHPERWASYCRALREGWRPTPMHGAPRVMANPQMWADTGMKPPGGRWQRLNEPREETILDVIHSGALCPPGRIPGNASPGLPRSTDRRPIAERFDWDPSNVTVRIPEG